MFYVTLWNKVKDEGKLVEVHYDKSGNIIGTYFANSRVPLVEFARYKHLLELDKEQKHPQTGKVWMKWYRYVEAKV